MTSYSCKNNCQTNGSGGWRDGHAVAELGEKAAVAVAAVVVVAVAVGDCNCQFQSVEQMRCGPSTWSTE